MDRIRIGLLVLMVSFLWADKLEYVGGIEIPHGSIYTIYVSGNYAYIGQWDRLSIVDISEPKIPQIVSSNYGDFFEGVGIHINDTLAYLNKLGGFFSILNVSNPLSPQPMGWVPVKTGTDDKDISHDFSVILPCYDAGIAIINVDDPTNPFVVSYYDTPGFAIDLFDKDSLVYVADYTSLQIIDIHDPEHPVGLGSLPMPEDRVGNILYCYDVFVVDTFAFVAAKPAEYDVYGNLFIISVADPRNPYYIDTVKVKGSPWCVYCAGDFAYVGAREAWAPEKNSFLNDTLYAPGGLRAVNKRKIEDAGVTSSVDMSWVRDVFVKDSLVYVVTEDSLLIFRHVYTGIEEEREDGVVDRVVLLDNHPNPCLWGTWIRYGIPERQRVLLTIYDVAGRRVCTLVNGVRDAGVYRVWWHGRDDENKPLPSGVYVCRLEAGGKVLSKKIVRISTKEVR